MAKLSKHIVSIACLLIIDEYIIWSKAKLPRKSPNVVGCSVIYSSRYLEHGHEMGDLSQLSPHQIDSAAYQPSLMSMI